MSQIVLAKGIYPLRGRSWDGFETQSEVGA